MALSVYKLFILWRSVMESTRLSLFFGIGTGVWGVWGEEGGGRGESGELISSGRVLQPWKSLRSTIESTLFLRPLTRRGEEAPE